MNKNENRIKIESHKVKLFNTKNEMDRLLDIGDEKFNLGDFEGGYDTYRSIKRSFQKTSSNLVKELRNSLSNRYQKHVSTNLRNPVRMKRGGPSRIVRRENFLSRLKKILKKRRKSNKSKNLKNQLKSYSNEIDKYLEKIDNKILRAKDEIIRNQKAKIDKLLNCVKHYERSNKLIMAFSVCERIINFMSKYEFKDWFKTEIEFIYKQWRSLHNDYTLEMYFNEMANRYYNTRKFEKAKTLYIKAKNIMKQDVFGEMLTRLIKLYLTDIRRCDCGINDNKARKLMRNGDRLHKAGGKYKAILKYEKAINLVESNPVKYRNQGLVELLRSKLTSI